MRLIWGDICIRLPSFGVVLAQAVAEVLIPACVDRVTFLALHVNLLGILLEVCNILSCVPSLEDCVCSLRLLSVFPNEVLAKTHSEFVIDHLPTRCSGRECLLVRRGVRGCLNDWLC